MLTAFLHCQPFEYYWDRSIPGGHCVDDLLIGYTLTSVNIGTDLIVLVLPIPWLLGMNMAVPKRLAVVGLFVLGSLYVILLHDAWWESGQAAYTVALSCGSTLTSCNSQCLHRWHSPPPPPLRTQRLRHHLVIHQRRPLDQRRMQHRHPLRLSPDPPPPLLHKIPFLAHRSSQPPDPPLGRLSIRDCQQQRHRLRLIQRHGERRLIGPEQR